MPDSRNLNKLLHCELEDAKRMNNKTISAVVTRINEDKNITTKCVINARPAIEEDIANSGGVDDAVELAKKQG